MGLLAQAIVRAVENRENLANPSRWLTLAFGGGQQTASGILVNESIALRSTTIMACVKIISETIAQLPLPVYRRLPKGKERAPEHPLYSVLHDRANGEMTAFDLREITQAHLLTWGNAYMEIERDNAGRIVGLWPMLPDRTWPYRDPVTSKIVYRTRIKKDPMSVSIDDTVTIQLPEEKVLHVKGLGFDGLKGYSVIQYAREIVAQDLALNEFAGRFFGNGAVPGGVLMTDKKLNKEQHDRLRVSWQDQHQGLTNAQRVAILEEGLQWKEIGIPLKDAQWVEARKYTRNELTSLYRIPPHMVGETERATSWGSGIEQQAIGFLVYTITPWVIRWEQAILARLLSPVERQQYFAEFLLDGLVRGDIDTRWKAYTAALDRGVLNPNEVRERENMNPYPGGDTYRVMANTMPAIPEPLHEPSPPSLGAGPARPALPAGRRPEVAPEDQNPSAASLVMVTELRLGLVKAQQHVLTEVFERAARREYADIVRGLEKRSVEDGAAFVRDFYVSHRDYVAKALLPAVMSYAEAIRSAVALELRREVPPSSEFWRFVRAYVASAAERYCSAGLRSLADISPASIPNALVARAAGAADLASAEAAQAGNALALAVYKDAGERRKVWMAIDRDAVCVALERGTLGLDERFGDRLHPPLHDGCTCIVLRAQPRAGRIILVRHGETEYNTPPQRYRGWKDIPLTSKGQRESENVADEIAQGYKVDRIYSSDLRRSSYGAKVLSDRTGAPVEETRGLRPWDIGELAGQVIGDGSAMKRYTGHPNEKVPGGESLQEFIDRLFAFLKPVFDRVGADGSTVAMVTHTRDLRAVLAWLDDPGSVLNAEKISSDVEPIDPSGYFVMQHGPDGWGKLETSEAPNVPTGAIPGNASAPSSFGPGSLGPPTHGWHPEPPNASVAM